MEKFTRLGISTVLLLSAGLAMSASDFKEPRARILHAEDIWQKNASMVTVIWDYQCIYDVRSTKDAGSRTMKIVTPSGEELTNTSCGYAMEVPSIGGAGSQVQNGLIWMNFGLEGFKPATYPREQGLYLVTIPAETVRFWLDIDPSIPQPDPETAPADAPWNTEVTMAFRALNRNFSLINGEQLTTNIPAGSTDLTVNVQYPENAVLTGTTLFADLLDQPVAPPKEQVPGQETYDDPDYYPGAVTIYPDAFSFENGVLSINLEGYINPELSHTYYIVLPNYQIQVEKNKIYSGSQILKVSVGDIYPAMVNPSTQSTFYVTEDNNVTFTYPDATAIAVATPDVVLNAENTKTGVPTELSYTVEGNVLTVSLAEVSLGDYVLNIPEGFLTINGDAANAGEAYYFTMARTPMQNNRPVFELDGEDITISITWPTEAAVTMPMGSQLMIELSDGTGDAKDVQPTDARVFNNVLRVDLYNMGITPEVAEYSLLIPQGYVNIGDDYQNAASIVTFNSEGLLAVESLEAENGLYTVYSLNGVKVMQTAEKTQLSSLPAGLYIINGKKVVVR